MRIKVADYDLRRENRIDGLAGYDAVEILLRNGIEPIGRARVKCEGDALDPGKLRVIARDLPWQPTLDTADVNLPRITVAICTRNRPDALASALRSLSDQVQAPHEVLVIDDGCQEEVRRLITSLLPHARYIPMRNSGLSMARNRALVEARESAIAFMDDDAVADPYWVRSIARCFAAFPHAAAVTGLTVPLELETKAQQLFEDIGGYARGFERHVLPGDRQRLLGLKLPLVAQAADSGTGCNMAFRSAVLKKIDGFDEALGAGPSQTGGGEDMDIFYRLMRAGYDLVYEPSAIVRHRHRSDELQLLEQLKGHQRGFTAWLVKTIGRERGWARFQVLLFLIWRLTKAKLQALRSLFGHGKLPLTFVVRIAWACYTGLGSYQASRRRLQSRTQQFGGANPSVPAQFWELWRYRVLVWNMCARDLKVKYQRSWLGFLWTLLNPLVMIGVLIAVFSHVIRIPIDHYWAFLISGYFTWNFFSQTLNGGVQAAVGNAHLTRSAYFPQEVLVLSSAIARLLEFLGELGVVLIILAVFHHKCVPLSYVMTLPLVALLFFLAVGIAFPLVTLAVYYHDTIQMIPLATTILFYLSPVFYSVDLVPEQLQALYLLNPMASLLRMFHDVLYHGEMPSLLTFCTLAGVAVLCGFLGYLVFNLKKREFAEIV